MANFIDPGTYSDGSPVFTSDLITDEPVYWYGHERSTYRDNFPAAFCPVSRYFNLNTAATSSTSYRDQTIGLKYPVVCLGELNILLLIIQWNPLNGITVNRFIRLMGSFL